MPSIVDEVVAQPGSALSPGLRAMLVPLLQSDLASVRVHTDARAAASATAVAAQAYTVGHHVAFGPGSFAPYTPTGRRLLVHELAHAVDPAPGLMRSPEKPPPGAKPDAGVAPDLERTFLHDLLPALVAEVAATPTPFAKAIGALYTAALEAALPANENAAAGTPALYPSAPAVLPLGGGSAQVNIALDLFQDPGSPVNGQAVALGTKAVIRLNVASADALAGNRRGIQATLVHEAMHVVAGLVRDLNAAAAPNAPRLLPLLEVSRYEVQRQGMQRLAEMVVRGAMLHTHPVNEDMLIGDARMTSEVLLDEALFRAEAALHLGLLDHKTLGPSDMPAPDFIHEISYWAPVGDDMRRSLKVFSTTLDSDMRPLVMAAQQAYLNERARMAP